MEKISYTLKKESYEFFIQTFYSLAGAISEPCGFRMPQPAASSSQDYKRLKTIPPIVRVFPKTVIEIQRKKERAIEQARATIDHIIAIPASQRTFENTVRALDRVESLSKLAVRSAVLSVVEQVYSEDEAMRTAAHEAQQALANFKIDMIFNNKELYRAFREYVQGNCQHELLLPEERRYLSTTMENFGHAGLGLPPEGRERVKKLKKEIVEHSLAFEKNINNDTRIIAVSEAELTGVTSEFKEELKRDIDGQYLLTTDFPDYDHIMRYCSCANTRKTMYRAFRNRAYPINKEVLQKLLTARQELAQLVGFPTYAAYDLVDQMAKTPDSVQLFLDSCRSTIRSKAEQEIKQMTAELPPSVILSPEGKVYPWDILYLQTVYKKKYFTIDDNEVKEYFPMRHTYTQLLALCKRFFNIDFKQLDVSAVPWIKTAEGKSPEVEGFEVIDNDTQQPVGSILIDLYPRLNKYGHACCQQLINPVSRFSATDGKPVQGAALVIANFPRETATTPALLPLHEVSTFFHEWGHALHAILGRTSMGSHAGLNTTVDFVETPSQMLEQWLWDKDILKMVSCHYKTGAPLPDSFIDRILASRTYNSGILYDRQLMYGNISLQYYHSLNPVDCEEVFKKILAESAPYAVVDPQNHDYASFGHITEYGSRYYGYLWTEIFAHDLFEKCKQEGLLTSDVGKRYVREIISKGGSVDPNELLRNFLGREPNDKAFLRNMGL